MDPPRPQLKPLLPKKPLPPLNPNSHATDSLKLELKPLVPKEEPSLLDGNAQATNQAATQDIKPGAQVGTSNEPVRARKRKAPAKSGDDWNRIRDKFEQLYVAEDKDLVEVSAILEKEEGFVATLNQYKTTINKWKLKKNISKREYAHIIRKDQERQNDEPGIQTNFYVRRLPVKREKINRFMTSHPAIGLPRSNTPSSISWSTYFSKTPSDISWSTYLSEILPQLQSGDHRSPIEIPSTDLSMAVTELPLQGTNEPAERLWLSYDHIEGLLEIEDNDSQVDGSGRGRPKPRFSSDLSTRGSPILRRPQLRYFGWWVEYRGRSVYSLDNSFTTVLKQFFPGFIISRDTYEAEMEHQQKSHEHNVLAVEANLQTRYVHVHLGRHLATAVAQGLISPSKEDCDPRTIEEQYAAIVSSAEKGKFAAPLILVEKAKAMQNPASQLPALSSYPVDIRWCVSEAIQLSSEFCCRFPSTASHGLILLVAQYGLHSAYEALPYADQVKVFEGFGKMFYFGLTCRYYQTITQFHEMKSAQSDLGSPKPAQEDRVRSLNQNIRQELFHDIWRFVQNLGWWFDPLREILNLRKGLVALENSFRKLRATYMTITGLHSLSYFNGIINVLLHETRTTQILLRFAQTLPDLEDETANADFEDALKQQNLSSPSQAFEKSSTDKLSSAPLWVLTHVRGPEIMRALAGEVVETGGKRERFKAAAEEMVRRSKYVDGVIFSDSDP